MGKRTFGKRVRHRALVMAAILLLVPTKAGLAQPANSSDGATTTPIKHVVIIIGENRTFDEIFATYQPVRQGDHGFKSSPMSAHSLNCPRLINRATGAERRRFPYAAAKSYL